MGLKKDTVGSDEAGNFAFVYIIALLIFIVYMFLRG